MRSQQCRRLPSLALVVIRRSIDSQLTTCSWRIQGTSTQQRLFASKRKAPRGPKQNVPRKNPTDQRMPRARNLPQGVFVPDAADTVPPVYLSPTASPYVYIATCAAEEHEIDPKSLFLEEEEEVFYADYVSPKTFKHDLPKWNIPEVAFLGRSNVGKSSLVNALLKKELARCSKQPGRTQTVNYFGLFGRRDVSSPSEAAGFFVDLPGYGFAKAPVEHIRAWQKRTQAFLLHRRDAGALCRLFLLVDARRGTSQIDRDIMGWMDEAEIPYTIVLTKADRVGRPQIVRFVNDICMRHHGQMYGESEGSQGPVVHVTSARDGYGIAELMTSIDAEFVAHREQEVENPGANAIEEVEPWRDYEYDDADKDQQFPPAPQGT